MNMFTCEKLKENITSIVDPAGVRAFLIEGTEKAALVDTCCGIGDLKELVESITSLPLIVLCTHGHVDHAGGTYGFDEVYLNEADWEVVKGSTTYERRSSFVNSAGTVYPKEDYVPQRDGNYRNLEDHQIFDLGGITLESIAVKGHTPGMTAILLRENRTLILGDACNPFTFMFLNESTDIRTLMDSLHALQQREGDFDHIWMSHGDVECDKCVIETVLDVCQDILDRKDDAIPMDSMGRPGLIAKAVSGPKNARVDGKVGNVVYGLNKL